MNKLGLVVPAVFLVVGAYLLFSGLTSDANLVLLGREVNVPAKFGILLGGIGVFGGVVVAFEMLTNKRSPNRPEAVRH